MRMEFRYHPIPSLPSLAWCAGIDRGSEAVPVFHGMSVEIRPEGFIEGGVG